MDKATRRDGETKAQCPDVDPLANLNTAAGKVFQARVANDDTITPEFKKITESTRAGERDFDLTLLKKLLDGITNASSKNT